MSSNGTSEHQDNILFFLDQLVQDYCKSSWTGTLASVPLHWLTLLNGYAFLPWNRIYQLILLSLPSLNSLRHQLLYRFIKYSPNLSSLGNFLSKKKLAKPQQFLSTLIWRKNLCFLLEKSLIFDNFEFTRKYAFRRFVFLEDDLFQHSREMGERMFFSGFFI